MGFDSY